MSEKLRWTENRRLGAAVLVVCALFSVFVCGGVKLRNLRASAISAFYEGGGDAYFSLDSYLKREAEQADVLLAAAINALGASDERVVSLKALCERVQTGDEDARISAHAELLTVEASLYEALKTGSDAKVVQRAHDSITDAARKMRNDEYNARAQSFNQERGGFLAKLLCGLYGLRALPEVTF